MATQTIPENDGPALALSDLYAANDLLNTLRTVSENSMGSAEWTLTTEVKRRLDSAIAAIDGAVPAYEESPAATLSDIEKPDAAEGIADSVATDDDEDEDQPERLGLHTISDRLEERLRWAHGVLDMMASASDGEVAEPIADAASGAAQYLREALEVVRSLDRWRYEHKPVEPRDLSNPNQVEDEKRDIVRRMLKLDHKDTMDVTMCHIMLLQMDDQDEGLRLLEKYPLANLFHFLSVRKDESERENATPVQ